MVFDRIHIGGDCFLGLSDCELVGYVLYEAWQE